MGNCDVQSGDGFRCFRDDDVSILVSFFNQNGFLCGFHIGIDSVHRPEDFFQCCFLGIIHGGNILRIIGVSVDLHRIDRQYLWPYRTGTGGFHLVVNGHVPDRIQRRLIVHIDLLDYTFHGHWRAGIFAGKEDAEAGTHDQCHKHDNDDDNHGNPAACSDCRNQFFDCGDDRLDCGNTCLGSGFGCSSRCSCCGSCNLYRFLRRLCRSLCRLLGSFGSFLCRLNGYLGRLLSSLNRLLCALYRAFQGLCGLFCSTGGLFNSPLGLLECLDRTVSSPCRTFDSLFLLNGVCSILCRVQLTFWSIPGR